MTTPTIDYDKYLERLFRCTNSNKLVPACSFCSDIESGIVIGFWQTPDKPNNFMSQRCFAAISQMLVLK